MNMLLQDKKNLKVNFKEFEKLCKEQEKEIQISQILKDQNKFGCVYEYVQDFIPLFKSLEIVI